MAAVPRRPLEGSVVGIPIARDDGVEMDPIGESNTSSVQIEVLGPADKSQPAGVAPQEDAGDGGSQKKNE